MNFDAIELEVALALGADLAADPGTWTWTSMADPANGHDGEHARQLSQDVRIARGRQDETSRSQPAETAVVFDNLDGALTAKNPMSRWWPNVRRGTPLRVAVAGARTGLANNYATTPDHATLDIVGDLDLRWDGVAGIATTDLIVKNAGAGTLSYWLRLFVGFPQLRWTVDGTTQIARTATAPIAPNDPHHLAVRATLDVNDGAGGHVVRFYTAPTLAGPWRPLGDPVTTAGTTSIHSGSGSVGVGSTTTTTYAAEVRAGIDGTVVTNPQPELEAAGATTFVDAAGRTWTVASSGAVAAIDAVRFVGNAASFAPEWPDGDNATADTPAEHLVTVTASGILRRLGRNDIPTASLLRRAIDALGPVAYWPLEDPAGSGAAQPAQIGDPTMTVAGGTFAGATVAPGSAPVVLMSAAFTASGRVPAATAGQWSASFLYLPDGQSTETVALSVYTTGTAHIIRISISASAGLIGIDAFNAAGTFIDGSSWGVGADVFSGPTWLHFDADQVGSAVAVGFQVENVDGVAGGAGDTFAGCTCGAISSVAFHAIAADGWGVGHLFTTAGPLSAVTGLPAGGHNGEDGVARLERVAAEAGIDISIAAPSTAEAMGPQPVAQLLDVLTEVADADLGILGEQVDTIGLAYRPRASLYAQAPRLTLDARAGGIVDPFVPLLDDQRLVNEVALSQTDGPTVTVVGDKTEGRYDTATTVNVASPYQLLEGAAWRLHLGSHDGHRYSTITIDLAQIASQLAAYCDLVQGDLVRITNLPSQHPPGPLDLIVEGITETIGSSSWVAELACSPGEPWAVGIFGDPVYGRIDSDASTLAAGIDDNDTSLSVAVSDAFLWSHADGDFDIDIGGEEMTVTAIAGASSPQTFTVTRSANGVAKAHAAGASVRLAHPLILAW